MQNIIKSTVTTILLIIMTGCATNRGEIDIKDIVSTNPSSGKALKFVRVTDKRDFQIKPKLANIPSLKNDEINDTSITARAIARKRNTFGLMPFG